jgi:hypothetical protein
VVDARSEDPNTQVSFNDRERRFSSDRSWENQIRATVVPLARVKKGLERGFTVIAAIARTVL